MNIIILNNGRGAKIWEKLINYFLSFSATIVAKDIQKVLPHFTFKAAEIDNYYN